MQYTEKDMVDVVDAAGEPAGSYPKRWIDTEFWPEGVKPAKPVRQSAAEKKAADEAKAKEEAEAKAKADADAKEAAEREAAEKAAADAKANQKDPKAGS